MSEAKKSKASILIVDDDETFLAILKETLTSEGYDVTAESSPVAALATLREKQFAVLLSDQQMPLLTGLEFLAQARAIQPDVTRILITGVVNLNTVIDAINKGEIYRFIVKPWLREELFAALQNGVQRYDMLRQTQELQARTLAANKSLAAESDKVAEQNQLLENLNAALRRNLDQSVELCLKILDAYWPVLRNQAHRVQELCRGHGRLAESSARPAPGA